MSAPAALLGEGDPDPMLAVGRGLPNVPWTIRQRDRIYNVLLAGGQGSGKSSLLLRVALSDALAANTATVVLDMKGSLSERLLRLLPPDVPKRYWDEGVGDWRRATKRVWYLDLARPAFGLTPLRVEGGWTPTGLADEFARIGDSITRALLDLYPGQIMGSSEDLIERAVVGTMAIAWWEHEQRAKREDFDPTSRGFTGSFEVLAHMFSPSDRFEEEEADNRGARRRVRPNRWHQAAGRACQRLPNLDQVADTLLYEIPRQARDNLGDIAKRMEAPANKIRPLVGAAASVRRFVGHPERLALRSVIEAHDTLIVNPRIELIGEDQAAILTNLIVHMLDLQLKRQVAVPRSRRPRVALIIDEAHRLITDTLITMIATHREAGLNVAAAVQYVSQLGVDEPTAARREKIIKGVGNLLQTKVLFRMSDSDDANRHSQIFRSVYETMVRADPTSRARMPFDPARMQTLRDHHALVSLVSSPVAGEGDGGLLAASHGATRLPAFVTQTYAMADLEEIPDTWGAQHLARQAEIFTRYPEDMSRLAVHDVPAGLSGTPAPPDDHGDPGEARRVAEETIGRTPEGALRKTSTPAPDAPAPDADAPTPPPPGEPAGKGRGARRKPAKDSPSAADRARANTPADGETDAGAARPVSSWEEVGGVRIERAEDRQAPGHELVADSRVLRFACRPTTRPLPAGDKRPATEAGQDALRAAAALASITRLSDWQQAGHEALEQARRAAQQAREETLADARAAGRPEQEAAQAAERHGRRAAQTALTEHTDAPWRTPVTELRLSDTDAEALEVIARLYLAAPKLLARLLEEHVADRMMRERLGKLHEAALIARANVGLEGRRGRPPLLYAIAPRGLDYLRHRRSELAPGQDPPRYLAKDRKLPSPGKGREVPHELAVQVCLVALGQYQGPGGRLHWHTTRMPGGRWDVGMVHKEQRDRTMRLADLLPASGLVVQGERLDAPPVLEPDLSVQLQGAVEGERAVIDLLVEVDRTGRGAYNRDKYAAYDQFLGGWCLRTRHFGAERGTRPVVAFVAAKPETVLTLLHQADAAMTLGFGARGHYDPAQFEYPGRAHTAFTCLDWLLAGQALALRLPSLPPEVRGRDTQLRPERVALLPEQWWPTARAGAR